MLRIASTSPRRLELLRLLDVPHTAVASAVEESRHASPDTAVASAVEESPPDSPARAKADAAARPGDVTLAADTEVRLEEERIGKPRDAGDAVTMLANLAGKTHDVRTEVFVVGATGRHVAFAVRSRVTMRELALREIERYVSTGEPLDKAGGYAIQGVGRRLVESYEGCLANVTGLPLCHVYFALRRAGVVPRERPEVVCQRHFDFVCPVWRAAQRQARALREGADYRSWSEDVAG